MFIKPKKGECHSHMKETWKLNCCRELSWQHHSTHFCMSFLTYITVVKFLLQCLNISGGILDFVICLHTVTTSDVISCILVT